MTSDQRVVSEHFPRSSQYHPDWVLANASGGANALWLTEWLASELDLRPGMNVLDLGCGRASSSIFLRREFGVQVWATDLWFSAAENIQRILDARVEDGVFPLNADARSLPFAPDFFDVILCVDSICYFGTDDLYLNYLARFVKPGGSPAIPTAVAPDNETEIKALEADGGSWLGYVRVVGRRNSKVKLSDPIACIPPQYVKKPLLRREES